MNYPSWIEINLDRLAANLAWWKALIAPPASAAPGSDCINEPRTSVSGGSIPTPPANRPPCLLGAVVKADAYGLGAVPLAKAMAQLGADCLFVYSLAEAEELLLAGLKLPIAAFMPMDQLDDSPAIIAAAKASQLHLSIDDLSQLRSLNAQARKLSLTLPVHLHLDTGMGRAGLSAADFAQAVAQFGSSSNLRLAGIYSHLATAFGDHQAMLEQLRKLDAALTDAGLGNTSGEGGGGSPAWKCGAGSIASGTCGQVLIHLASTGAACRDRRFHRDLVRVGLGLYGYGPDQVAQSLIEPRPPAAQGVPLPIARWLSRIIHVRAFPAGIPVGYDGAYRLTRDSRLAVVPAGYGYGYPWRLGNQSSVRLVDEHDRPLGHAPVRGRINMDQIVIDLTDLPPTVTVGCKVELISAQPDSLCAVPALAKQVGTNSYEILCRLSPKIPRVYRGNNQSPKIAADKRR
ncbi:MAG: alanine racemase [Phycisphaeraceae bacterium]|nr:alanine racemase [Phycisphaeraceae bacterium]